MIFYTSDWHIIHKKIIRLTNRPFLSVDEMTHEMIRRYHACVSDTDTCYFLGDIFVAPRDGKTHGEKWPDRMLNACVEVNRYAPAKLEQLIQNNRLFRCMNR